MLSAQRNLPSVGWLIKAPFEAVSKLAFLAARSCLPMYREKIINDEIARHIISTPSYLKSHTLSEETLDNVKLGLMGSIRALQESPGGCIGAAKVLAAVTVGAVAAGAATAVTGVIVVGTPAGVVFAAASGSFMPIMFSIGYSTGAIGRALIERSAWYEYVQPKFSKLADFIVNHSTELVVGGSIIAWLCFSVNMTSTMGSGINVALKGIAESSVVGGVVEKISWLTYLETASISAVAGLIFYREATITTARLLVSEDAIRIEKKYLLLYKLTELKAAKKHEGDEGFIKIAINKMQADEKQKLISEEQDEVAIDVDIDNVEQISNEQLGLNTSFYELDQLHPHHQLQISSAKTITPLIFPAIPSNEDVQEAPTSRGVSQLQTGDEEVKARTQVGSEVNAAAAVYSWKGQGQLEGSTHALGINAGVAIEGVEDDNITIGQVKHGLQSFASSKVIAMTQTEIEANAQVVHEECLKMQELSNGSVLGILDPLKCEIEGRELAIDLDNRAKLLSPESKIEIEEFLRKMVRNGHVDFALPFWIIHGHTQPDDPISDTIYNTPFGALQRVQEYYAILGREAVDGCTE